MFQQRRARLAALIVSLIGVSNCALVFAAAPDGVLWQTDLEVAKRIATQTNRLVLVHFWSPSCAACKELDKDVFSQPKVQQTIQANFVPVKLNADDWPTTVKFYGITKLPSDLVIAPGGQIVGRMISPLKPDPYLQQLAIAASGKGPAATPAGAVMVASMAGGANPALAAFAPLGSAQGATAPMDSAINGVPAASPFVAAQVPTMPATPNIAAAPAVSPGFAQGIPQGTEQIGSAQMPAYDPTVGPRYSGANATPGVAWGAAQPTSQPVASNSWAASPATAPVNPMAGASNPVAAITPSAAVASQTSISANPPAMLNYSDKVYAEYQQRFARPAAAPAAAPQISMPANPATTAFAAPQVTPGFVAAPPASGFAAAPAAAAPPMGMDGYDPVTLVEQHRWQVGDRRFGAIHRGCTYLFVGPEEQKKFLANPDRYSPAISGHDVVAAMDYGQEIDGRRALGVEYGNRVYLFSSEATRQAFMQNRDHYAAEVLQAENPGQVIRR